MNRLVINFLLPKSGKLPKDMTWYDLGVKCNIKSPNKKRAKKEKKYMKKSIARTAQRVWQKYLSQKDNLSLDKETYSGGELKFETYKRKPKEVFINSEDFEIEKYTTNPYGGSWVKMKKKENFHTEEHLEKLKTILKEDIKPISYIHPTTNNKKAHFVYGSDKHIGALTKLDSIYQNKYDKDIMRKRIVLKTIENIEASISLHNTFEDLYIMDFGDALDGYNQKTTRGLSGASSHTLPQQLNNREQHDFYLEIHRELFDHIMSKKYAKNIYYIATSDSNHGGAFEYGAMRSLQVFLELKYPSIRTYVSYKPYNHFIYGKHAIVFGHGKDEEDMRNGLPLVINDKVASVLSDYIRVNKLEKYNVSVVTGDLHQSAETYAKNFRYKKVLSQYGSSKWMHTNFGSGQPGLSSEVFVKNSSKIYKEEDFFEIKEESNTGINFKE